MTNVEEFGANTLYAKMARIMGQIKRLKKSGHNQHFNYDFATDADVTDTIRELLAQENVGLFASMPSYEKIAAGTSSKGVVQYNTIVHLEITLACGDSGATFTTHWHGEAIGTDDKGINKAATSAEKYWLLKTFLLSTGDAADDPDSSASTNGAKQPRTVAPQATNNAPVQPKHSTPANATSAPQNADNGDFDNKYWNGKLPDLFAIAAQELPTMPYQERNNTIKKMAEEGAIKEGMKFNECVAAVLERVQSHHPEQVKF